MPRSSNDTSGFTLIELLICVAIIGVLVSLLIPSLGQSREMARSLQCSANLKQIGTGFQIYADSYRDYIPASTVSRSAGNFIDALGSAGAVGPVDPAWRVYNGGSTGVTNGWKVFEDPAEKPYNLETGSSYVHANWSYTRARFSIYASSYSMNWDVSRYTYGKPRKGWNKGPDPTHPWNASVATQFNLSRMTTPSSAPIMADGQAYNLYFLDEIDTYGPSHALNYLWLRASHAFRHPHMTANVLYMDGHVKPKKHFSQTGERIWRYLWVNDPV